jgi:phosphonate transport system substrate-binding protein
MISTRLAAIAAVLFSLAVLGAEKKPIKFGIAQPYGEESAKKAKEQIEPYLSGVLNCKVTVIVHPTYEALSDALATNQVDIAWITPLAFVRASQKNPEVAALSKAMRAGDGSLFYRSIFIVKKDSPATKLADLKGKKVAWVNKLSASGYLFPKEILRREGLDPDKFFGEETFGGDHPAVCKAVREGKADVAATFARGTKEEAELKADGCEDGGPVTDFKIIASTGSLPNEVIAAGSDFPPLRYNEVLGAFGKMGKTDAGKKVLKESFRAEGWGVAVDGDFAPVIDLLKATDAKAKVAPPQDAPPARDPKKKK